MLPRLGINRNIRRGLSHISQTYGGVGLRKILTEVSTSRIVLFL